MTKTGNGASDLELLAQLLADTPDIDIMDSALRAQISAAIVRERIARKMNQQQFARFMGKSQSTISKWESGDIIFSTRLLAEIALKLDLDVDIQLRDSRSQYSPAASRRAPVAYGSHDLLHPVFSYAAH